jgi:hypothetical protein
MLNRDRFDYSTQEHFGICVVFSFAKAIDALSRHTVSFFDVMKCLYGFTQRHLKKYVSPFTKWQDLVTPMIMSWNEFINMYGKSMQIDDLNHDFLSKHLFKEVTKLFPNNGIICSHLSNITSTCYNQKNALCVILSIMGLVIQNHAML